MALDDDLKADEPADLTAAELTDVATDAAEARGEVDLTTELATDVVREALGVATVRNLNINKILI